MTETLRPMNLSGILDRAVQVFRAQPMLFFGLAAIPGLAGLAYQLAAVHPKFTGTGTAGHVVLIGLSYLASFLLWVTQMVLTPMSTAAVCLAVSRVNVGERITIGEAFGAFRPHAGRLVWLSFLQGIYSGWPLIIALFVAVIVGSGVGMLAGSTGSAVAMWIALLLGAIPCVALFTRYALAFPATAIENLAASQAIDRSVDLSEGGRWTICWGFLVPMVPSMMLSLGSLALTAYLEEYSALLANNPLVVAAINGGVDLIATLVFTPYSAIVLTLLYYDRRIRQEGYDVERMMAAAGLDGAALPPPASPWTQLPAEEDHGA